MNKRIESKIDKLPVLDVGFVRYEDHMGTDLTTANAARVSMNKRSALGSDGKLLGKDAQLISYLAKHKHWVPLAHPHITLHIKAPIFVRAQMFKHKIGLTETEDEYGFLESEMSRRYVKETPEFYEPLWRTAPQGNIKQGSHDFMDSENAAAARLLHKANSIAAHKAYDDLLKLGVCPEQARTELPQGMYTEWWWTGSLAAYARVFLLRIDGHAQWETRQYAKAIEDIVAPLYPVAWKALTES